MADNQPSSSIPIARPAQVLDPYPERSTHLVGVRQPTPLAAIIDLPYHQALPAEAPAVFAASVERRPSLARRMRLPIASTILSILGQAALGASIAAGTVEPVIGAAVSVAWLTCGLALIVAQTISIVSSRR